MDPVGTIRPKAIFTTIVTTTPATDMRMDATTYSKRLVKCPVRAPEGKAQTAIGLRNCARLLLRATLRFDASLAPKSSQAAQ